MGKFQRLFKHTIIYGMVTVLPRVLGLFLTPLYIDKLSSQAQYGIYSVIISYMILGNVVLSYGMETAFFRFWNNSKNPSVVQSTAQVSIAVSSCIFAVIAFLLRGVISDILHIDEVFLMYAILILVLDALVVIPFAWLRAQGKSLQYSGVKIFNVTVNLLLNVLLFCVFSEVFFVENQVHYIFISNLIASFLTFLMMLRAYWVIGFHFDRAIWLKMIRYALPILLAGIAFSINEGFDRIFLKWLLPPNIADNQIGIYAACYKMGVFMTLFITAYRLGVEPFFFSSAKDRNAPQTYATVTLYFVIFGAFILLFISTFSDIFKRILIPNPIYWEAMWIVPYILLANLCLGIYHSLSVWYKVTDRTLYGAYISVLGSVVTLLMNYFLIPVMGYRGSALATLGAYASMMVISYIVGQRKYPIPYRFYRILMYLLYSIICSWVVFFVLKSYVFGVVLLIGYVILVFFFERELRSFLMGFISRKKLF